jgi:hypothetical protein
MAMYFNPDLAQDLQRYFARELEHDLELTLKDGPGLKTAVALLLQRPSSFENEVWARVSDWSFALTGRGCKSWRAWDASGPGTLVDTKLAETLQTFKAGEAHLSKDRFWRFVSAVADDYRWGTGGVLDWPYSAGKTFCLSADGQLSSANPAQLYVIDGQHRVIAGDLSPRDMRAILGSVAEEVARTTDRSSALDFIVRVHHRLSREIEVRAQKRFWSAPLRIDAAAPTVRDWVLAFIVHTGTSPPTSAASRPAVGRALFDAAAHEVACETICRRQARRDLPHPFCDGSAKSRYRRRARSRPSVGCLGQLTGRRRLSPDHSLGRFA